jgi:ribonucleoside-diphosphate reductase alpha chain
MTPRAVKKVIHRDGSVTAFKMEEIIKAIQYVVEGSKVDDPYVAVVKILKNFELKLPNEVTTDQIDEILLKAVEMLISEDPGYDTISSKQLAKMINKRIDNRFTSFGDYIHYAVKEELLSKELLDFDLGYLELQIDSANDDYFNYFGLSTLHNRYLTKDREQNVIEKPQWLWMRVAMGLSLQEENKEEFALRVYNQLSHFKYNHATPTLYNS